MVDNEWAGDQVVENECTGDQVGIRGCVQVVVTVVGEGDQPMVA